VRYIMLMLAVSGLAACAPTIMQASLSPADANIAAAMLEPGSSTISGSALLRQRGGTVVTCAGNDIYLIPATESATRELRRIFGSENGYVRRGGHTITGGGRLVAPPEPNRSGVCNAQGFFNFARVQPGKWHILTTVVWTVGEDFNGGTLLGTAEVEEGETTEIVLSQ
jgi:hypothetical protein